MKSVEIALQESDTPSAHAARVLGTIEMGFIDQTSDGPLRKLPSPNDQERYVAILQGETARRIHQALEHQLTGMEVNRVRIVYNTLLVRRFGLDAITIKIEPRCINGNPLEKGPHLGSMKLLLLPSLIHPSIPPCRVLVLRRVEDDDEPYIDRRGFGGYEVKIMSEKFTARSWPAGIVPVERMISPLVRDRDGSKSPIIIPKGSMLGISIDVINRQALHTAVIERRLDILPNERPDLVVTESDAFSYPELGEAVMIRALSQVEMDGIYQFGCER